MSIKDKTLLARRIAIGLIIAANSCMAGVAMAEPASDALPTGQSVKAGDININPSGNTMTIDQKSDKGIINWDSFNIGKDAKVEFIQPNGSSMTLNRVTGGDMSEIYGKITANGSVILVNPNGAYFDKNSRVNTAGFIVSTADMSNDDFLNGNYVWDQNSEKNSNITVDGKIWIRPRDAGTSISYGYNKIMIIADGDVVVGPNASLMANQKTFIYSTENLGDGFKGELTKNTSEGTIILRADQNADDVNQSGNAAKVYLNNTTDTQVQGVNVSVFYNSDIIGNVNGTPVSNIGVSSSDTLSHTTFTQKDYTKIGAEVNAYKEKIKATNVTVASLVNDVYQLQAIESTAYGNLDGSYALGTNIDAVDTANWNNGFNPIGNGLTLTPFTGSLTGNGGSNSYSISNLNINRSSEEYVGLFAYTNRATISSLTMIDPKIAGKNYVGAIAGYAKNSFFDGNIVTSTSELISTDTVVPDGTTANVRGTYYCVGGLIGSASATALRNCTNGAYVYGFHDVGGLVGWAEGDGTVTTNAGTMNYVSYDGKNHGLVAGSYSVGGLIGLLGVGTITGDKGSYNNGQVIGVGTNASEIGGLVGYMTDSTISNSYNTNEGSKINSVVQSTDYLDAANIMGSGSSPHGRVTGDWYVGGIVGGMYSSTLDTVYNAGNVKGKIEVGGIAGFMNQSTIKNAYNADNNTVYLSAQNDGEYYGFISNGVKYTFDKDSQTWTSYTLAADDSGYTTYKSGLSTDELPSEESRLYLNRLAYRDATVTGQTAVGGIVGDIYTDGNTLENTYNAGRVQGNIKVGSLVGQLWDVNSLTMKDGNSTDGNFVVTTQSVTGKNLVKGNDNGMKVIGGYSNSDGSSSDTADNYNSGSYEKTLFQASRPSADGTNGVAWTDGKNQNDTWVIYNNSTTPLLKHYMTGITTASRQYVYDGATHSVTTENVKNYYGGAFFTNVHTDGVDVITDEEYTVNNKWNMMTNNDGIKASASDDRSNSSFYKYDAAHMWSPQHGYYTNGYVGVIITPVAPDDKDHPITPVEPDDKDHPITPVEPDDKDHNIAPMPDWRYFPNASVLEDTRGRHADRIKYGFSYGLEGRSVFRPYLTLQDSGIHLDVAQMDNSIVVDRSSRSDGGDTITIKRKAVVVNSEA